MKRKNISPREALYGFCAWLTTRDEPIILSRYDNCDKIVELIEIWSKTNHLDKIRSNFPRNIKQPND